MIDPNGIKFKTKNFDIMEFVEQFRFSQEKNCHKEFFDKNKCATVKEQYYLE